ncbi:MAG: ATP-grasp domain-containing protein, partial [Gemmatimonadaceae bacterium]
AAQRPRGRQVTTTHDPGSALVTDSALRTALYTIRNLGRHGVRITAAERATSPAENLGGLSRYVSRRVTVPDNRTQPDAFADALLELAASHDVLVPIGMHSIGPVAKRLDEFRARTRVALPTWPVIDDADDTRRLLALARELGVPTPRTLNVPDYASVDELAEDLGYPAIVKLGVEAGLPPGDRYRIVGNRAELVAAVNMMVPITTTPIIQELVSGDGIGFEALYDYDGRMVASFCHRRLREYPVTGGPSTFCESCDAPDASRYGKLLLDRLGWIGLAMVEFKMDASRGIPILMEINPRPWGSMMLPILAGVEFPWLLFQLARDGSLPVQPKHRAGVRMRFLVNDLQAALAEWRRAPTLRGRLAIAGSILDPRVHEGILSLRDPRPSWAYLRKAAFRALR